MSLSEEDVHRAMIHAQLPPRYFELEQDMALCPASLMLHHLCLFDLKPQTLHVHFPQPPISAGWQHGYWTAWGVWILAHNPTFPLLCLEDPDLPLRLFSGGIRGIFHHMEQSRGYHPIDDCHVANYFVMHLAWKHLIREFPSIEQLLLSRPECAQLVELGTERWLAQFISSGVTERAASLLSDWSTILKALELPDLVAAINLG